VTIFVISNQGKPPHICHIAKKYTKGRVNIDGAEIYQERVITLCNRQIKHVVDVTSVSSYYTDGSVYMTECPTCKKRWAESVQ
jgi:hypothetical protein